MTLLHLFYFYLACAAFGLVGLICTRYPCLFGHDEYHYDKNGYLVWQCQRCYHEWDID